MAQMLSQRTNTSSTIDSELTRRETDDSFQKQPPTSGATKPGQRRQTLSHRKLVFYDPVAFRYLEEDDSTIVLARRERLQGYELYIVEQWVCSRVHPTFVITTHTGDPGHSILVNVLSVPNDENSWSERLKVYLHAVSEFHAREQETPLGILMVTNLSAFPSALTVIGVPDGDVRKHREDFIVNENLKRMNCTGRAAMNLQAAAPSTVAKFQHLYQTSESIPFKTSVIELVRLCQIALVLYGKLDAIYIDGLLCDVTEKAVQDWWNEIGTDFHNVEPSDGILGPTTVSALVGLMIGAYNRLRAAGVNVPKDVLDILPMKRAIGNFQKAYKVDKSRRLDRNTLDRLHRVTAKTANSEGWAVPRAVKSTVAELSGKGGEMVMGAIGANKEKIAISEVETLDIDKLAQLVTGERMRWLWQGKSLKSSRGEVFGAKIDEGLNGRVFSTDDQGNYMWTSATRGSVVDNDGGIDISGHDKSSLRRLRTAVGIPGLRSHNNRFNRHVDEHTERDDISIEPKSSRLSKEQMRPDHFLRARSSFAERRSLERQVSDKPVVDLALANADVEVTSSKIVDKTQSNLQISRNRSNSDRSANHDQLQSTNQPSADPTGRKRVRSELRRLHDQIQGDDYQKFATEFEEWEPSTEVLRRSKSALHLGEIEAPIERGWKFPRQLSFSLVEGSVFRLPDWGDQLDQGDSPHPDSDKSMVVRLSNRELKQKELKQLTARLLAIERYLLLAADAEVIQVEGLDQESQQHLAELNNIYYQRLDEYQSLQATSRDVVAREKASLNDGLRRIETLGQKLDYELDALQSRMQEVEDGAAEFERNVAEIEARVAQLAHDKHGTNAEPSDVLEEKQIPFFQRALNLLGLRQRPDVKVVLTDNSGFDHH